MGRVTRSSAKKDEDKVPAKAEAAPAKAAAPKKKAPAKKAAPAKAAAKASGAVVYIEACKQ